MFREFFRGASLLDLPMVAMFGFIVSFVAVVCWTMSRRRHARFDAMSRLPLDD
ncbi:MAG: CcoQ/FixQ family Cbb3-type cytochrome c oxidase assembly chaperone [Planctomycetes bacterium]|jgi:cbb3-type cytochrome oxidase subunit 3|nr:CcoQ/FixQ family Cbb3-type cytochrome c oxidase assembly chaperone [Planctomycetota bacterium]